MAGVKALSGLVSIAEKWAKINGNGRKLNIS
jgi:hypothetical protein